MRCECLIMLITLSAILAGCNQERQVEVLDTDQPWFLMQPTSGTDANGKRLVECIAPQFSPNEVMKNAQAEGWTYELVEDVEDENARPNSVIVNLHTPDGRRTIVYFRGRQYCEFAADALGYAVKQQGRYE